MYFNFIPIEDTDKHNYVMNGLVTDSLKNGGGLLDPDIFAAAPDTFYIWSDSPERDPTLSWYLLQR